MKKHKTKLAARVAAANMVNEVLLRQVEHYKQQFAPFMGKLICKNGQYSGLELTKAVNEKVRPLIVQDKPVSVSLRINEHNIWLEANGSQPVEQASDMSYHGTIYFARMNGKVLTEFNDLFGIHLRTDYTVKEIHKARQMHEGYAELARQAESRCNPFGLYDR